MNENQTVEVVARLMNTWPQVASWTDEQINHWAKDLGTHDYQRSLKAMDQCRELHSFPPSWAQFKDAYKVVTFAELAPERQPPANRQLREGVLSKEENMRRLRAMRKTLTTVFDQREHDHKPKKIKAVTPDGEPVLDVDGNPVMLTIEGVHACPVCSQHDWSDADLHRKDCRRCKRLGEQVYAAITKEQP